MTQHANFLWGAATSSYQIEGAVNEDGRTPSIWDTFCATPGTVTDGDTGAVACDHYHRMPEDVAIMAELGLDVYRFSLAWPRVQPDGTGAGNPAGIAFYDRLVDELLAKGIRPWVTLYHWDLPQALEDAGGWPSRDVAYRFADYAAIAYEALGDRVSQWTTLNEPWCSAVLGYMTGRHAPGRQDARAATAAVHHLLLGHGLAVRTIRDLAAANGRSDALEVGITLNLAPKLPASDSPADLAAAHWEDGFANRLYLDPLLRGEYPADVADRLGELGCPLPVQDGDLETIAQPVDVVGVNYYSSQMVAAAPTGQNGWPAPATLRRDVPRTAMDWEVTPGALTDLLTRLDREYPGPAWYITENGAAYADTADETGYVDDAERAEYLREHIDATLEARDLGVNVRGYFAWSLLDNFEWSFGYDRRFGIVRVDYDTLERTPKRSARYYAERVAAEKKAAAETGRL
ncbi:GH1 family beta-glucosidase [Planotetraspora kaengkrachanensis]|uniref:Beta-glucosidase n=1 Tax=Planotetraspora kaengkrachanensis TaxID=575193 RepID=A0A8J3V7P2_9ACTN|nr:GH1 family beta-glucosidase [Planotetraspora kaengkrachanensis]GIG82270.1 beta-glucosidase [Planotetraspora kaengkrachanensis]